MIDRLTRALARLRRKPGEPQREPERPTWPPPLERK